MIKKIPKNSLRILPQDKRDFNLGAIFKQMKVEDIPKIDFYSSENLHIKDQGNTDYCSGYAVTAVSEDQEEVELLPEFQFYKTKEISGDKEEWGANLRDACKSAVEPGSLPVKGFESMKEMTRSQILNTFNWPHSADEVAKIHKKQTFFKVAGRYDTFDNIRCALWQNIDKKCSVVTGALWRQEWLDVPGGIIPSQYGADGFGHAFKIFGQKIINGEIYLVAQLSQGTELGDHGLFYFSREITNKEIGAYGLFMFYDISKEEVKNILENKDKLTILQKIWSLLSKFLNK